MLFTVVEGNGAGREARSSSRAASNSATACRRRPLGQFDELIRGRPQPAARARATGRRCSRSGTGRRRGSSSTGRSTPLRRCAGPRSCSAGRRSSPTHVPSSRPRERIPSADRADRRVAGGGARPGRARPPDRGRRPHPRRQVRRAGAEAGARDRGVLRRRARLAAQPGAPPRAAARGGRVRGGTRADLRPVRPRHRRRHPGRRPRSRSWPRSSPSGPAARAAR